MIFNSDKFQAIVVRKTAKIKDSYSLNVKDLTIISDTSLKLLGIEIDNKLSFEQHIFILCNRYQVPVTCGEWNPCLKVEKLKNVISNILVENGTSPHDILNLAQTTNTVVKISQIKNLLQTRFSLSGGSKVQKKNALNNSSTEISELALLDMYEKP